MYDFLRGRFHHIAIYKCMQYTKLVYIRSLSGTQLKKEPLVGKGSQKEEFSRLCSFLYILDMTGFSQDPGGRRMYKKRTFYSYARPHKNKHFLLSFFFMRKV